MRVVLWGYLVLLALMGVATIASALNDRPALREFVFDLVCLVLCVGSVLLYLHAPPSVWDLALGVLTLVALAVQFVLSRRARSQVLDPGQNEIDEDTLKAARFADTLLLVVVSPALLVSLALIARSLGL